MVMTNNPTKFRFPTLGTHRAKVWRWNVRLSSAASLYGFRSRSRSLDFVFLSCLLAVISLMAVVVLDLGTVTVFGLIPTRYKSRRFFFQIRGRWLFIREFSGKKREIAQVKVQTQVQVKLANLSRKHKNEMFKWIADTWPGFRDDWCEVEPIYCCFFSRRISELASSLAAESKFANLQSPIQSSHPHPAPQHCRTASRRHRD